MKDLLEREGRGTVGRGVDEERVVRKCTDTQQIAVGVRAHPALPKFGGGFQYPLSPTVILSFSYSELLNISESDLREVERETERRLLPFACGVGECIRI